MAYNKQHAEILRQSLSDLDGCRMTFQSRPSTGLEAHRTRTGTMGPGTVVGQEPQDDHSAQVDDDTSDNGDDESDDKEECGCMPTNNSEGTSSTPMEYAKLIEPELGVPPVVDCGASVEMPIYVDGEKTTGNSGLHCCDNPSSNWRLHVWANGQPS